MVPYVSSTDRIFGDAERRIHGSSFLLDDTDGAISMWLLQTDGYPDSYRTLDRQQPLVGLLQAMASWHARSEHNKFN